MATSVFSALPGTTSLNLWWTMHPGAWYGTGMVWATMSPGGINEPGRDAVDLSTPAQGFVLELPECSCYHHSPSHIKLLISTCVLFVSSLEIP